MMPVRLDTGTGLLADYKLRPGVSEQYVALEIMKASGMDDDIVRDAIGIKENILRGSRLARKKTKAVVPKDSEKPQPPSETGSCADG
jgi:DNA mismatch repair ATPase MutS